MWINRCLRTARSRGVDLKTVNCRINQLVLPIRSMEGPGVRQCMQSLASLKPRGTQGRPWHTHCRQHGPCAEYDKLSTLIPTILSPQPATLYPAPYTLHPAPSTFNPVPCTLYSEPSTPTPSLNPKSSTLNLNPQPEYHFLQQAQLGFHL